jgi:hypothetical protein
MMNDLRVCARLARPQTGHTFAVTSGTVLPLFTGARDDQDGKAERTSHPVVRSWSHRATKCRQSEPSPQGTKHSVDRAKLSLMSVDDASLTPDTGQVAGALGPRQLVEVRFQRLATSAASLIVTPRAPQATHATFIDNRHTAVTATPARGLTRLPPPQRMPDRHC